MRVMSHRAAALDFSEEGRHTGYPRGSDRQSFGRLRACRCRKHGVMCDFGERQAEFRLIQRLTVSEMLNFVPFWRPTGRVWADLLPVGRKRILVAVGL